MRFFSLLIILILSLRNVFSEKSFKAILVNRAIVIYRSNPEIVIHDYYFYVQKLLLNSLKELDQECLIFFECPKLKLLKNFFKHYEVFLQIEHTLLDPIEKNHFAISGNLSTLDGEGNYLVRIVDFEKLNAANLVIDYSRINLFNIRSVQSLKNFFYKTICVSPSLYPIDTHCEGRSGVITMFGNPEISRRKLFLDGLKKNQIEYQNIRGIYFEVEKVYQKAKIIVNIRQTDFYHTLEELRILPALRSGAIIISEIAPYFQKTFYSKFIIFGTIDELPSLIKEVEQNYEAVHQRIFGDGSTNSHFMRRMRRIEKCNAIWMSKAVQHLNNSNCK